MDLTEAVQFHSSLSRVWLFVTPWTAECQASLSITNSQSLSKPMSIESVMLSSLLILCCPLLLLPSIFPSIRVFSKETEAEDIKKRWQEYTEELYRKDLDDPDNHDGMITQLEPEIL